jgi:hypothetical protein
MKGAAVTKVIARRLRKRSKDGWGRVKWWSRAWTTSVVVSDLWWSRAWMTSVVMSDLTGWTQRWGRGDRWLRVRR